MYAVLPLESSRLVLLHVLLVLLRILLPIGQELLEYGVLLQQLPLTYLQLGYALVEALHELVPGLRLLVHRRRLEPAGLEALRQEVHLLVQDTDMVLCGPQLLGLRLVLLVQTHVAGLVALLRLRRRVECVIVYIHYGLFFCFVSSVALDVEFILQLQDLVLQGARLLLQRLDVLVLLLARLTAVQGVALPVLHLRLHLGGLQILGVELFLFQRLQALVLVSPLRDLGVEFHDFLQ